LGIASVETLKLSVRAKASYHWNMQSRVCLLAALLVLASRATLLADAPPPSHADAFSKDGLVKVDVSKLKDTQLVPHPNAPIAPGQNVIWCGTMQLAWNKAIDLVGEKLQFENPPPVVALLNREDFTAADLDPASYVAIADFERFHGAASPELIPPVPPNPGPDDFVAYAYLFKNLAFKQPFLDGAPITFGDTKVKSFGFTGQDGALRDRLASQVTICSYNSDDDFVIKLKTNDRGDELILAKVPPGNAKGDFINPNGPNLWTTINYVNTRAMTLHPESAGPGDMLAIPKLNFDLRKDFAELEGLTLNPSPAAKIKSKLVIAKAEQLVRFQLNEKGAILKSEAVITMRALAEWQGPPPRRMIFDHPFLILMKRADAAQPYFAMWVGNASLLVPAK
jgi:hypothetical protein